MAQEEIFVKCSNCATALKVFASDVDRIVKCHVCQKFTKVPGRGQKRMELQCANPACSTIWNIPVKLRGKIHKCWNCHQEVQLPSPAELNVEEISLVEQIEQGGKDYEMLITVSNPGTPAKLSDIQLAFENHHDDVTAFYEVRPELDPATLVDFAGHVQIKCKISTTPQTPIGSTNIHVEVTGEDTLDESVLSAKAAVGWTVLPQRVFAIATEHDYHEQAGIPFAVQLVACLTSGEADTTYQGSHYIQFQSNATPSVLGMNPIVPPKIQVEFQAGIGVTGQEFLVANTAETPEIIAWEEALGGPKGATDPVQVLPGPLHGFEIVLAAPQLDLCPFTGDNHIYAIDQYGNIVDTFAEDIWIYPASNIGDLGGQGFPPNVIPGNAFQNGIADLTALRFVYTADPNDALPKEESFIVSYQEKEGCSNVITLQANPIEIGIASPDLPDKMEQGEEYLFHLAIHNNTPQISLVIHDMDSHFFSNNQPVDSSYQIYWQNQGAECLPDQKSILTFQLQPSADVPIGATQVELVFHLKDQQERFYGQGRTTLEWKIEPKGRLFEIVSPTNLTVDAGKKFGIQVAAKFQGKVDTSYSGKHTLIFQSNASPSPHNKLAEIPAQLEIMFTNGVGNSPEEFCFTNSGESPKLSMLDPTPGGPRNEGIQFQVLPVALGSFLLSFQDNMINGEAFGQLNQIIALDTHGNLKHDFAKNCAFYPASQRGKLCVQGKAIQTIHAEAFEEGIVDLGSMGLSYQCEIQEKLPKQEEFTIECDGKKGKSNSLKIVPRPAKIVIVRCSAPGEIEPGGKEYPIYLELENQGDLSATISSVLFSFEQKNDVSAHYTIIPSQANTNLLIPGIPLQLAYTVKSSIRTPLGSTKIEAKVTGLETESKLPLQGKTYFEWSVESGQRSYRLKTEHGNTEEAGVLFAVQIESYIENNRDATFNGEVTLQFRLAATSGNSGKLPSFPESLTVLFKNGEARTPAKFMVFNTKETPIIKATDSTGRITGQTEAIRVVAGVAETLQAKLAMEFKEKEVWEGANTITVVDSLGNIKEDFTQEVGIGIEGIQGYLCDDKMRKINTIPAAWFHKGIADLGLHQIQIICAPDQKLPAKGSIILALGNKRIRGGEFEVTGRPITVELEQIQAAAKVVQGQRQSFTFTLLNKGMTELVIATIEVAVNKDGETYRYPVQADPRNFPRVQPGGNSFTYFFMVPTESPVGKVSAKVNIRLATQPSGTELVTEAAFSCYIEPAGRRFNIQTENRQKEMAGVPFALRIATTLQGKSDQRYEGMRTLQFTSKASASPFGQAACIPKMLRVEFHDGEATTSRDFILFNISEVATIEVAEDLTGGPMGVAENIALRPSGLQEFRWSLTKNQINTVPFQGSNTLIAIDSFGNVKTDFQEDVRVVMISQKGELVVGSNDIVNLIPGRFFQGGSVDLTALKLACRVSKPDSLPLQERLVASYGEKKGESEEFAIQPRPLAMSIDKMAFSSQVFQAEKNKPLTFTLKNSGDLSLRITQIIFDLDNQGQDVSTQFNVGADPKNAPIINAISESQQTYYLDIDPQANVGSVKLTLTLEGTSTRQDDKVQKIEVTGSVTFEVQEKQRELVLATQHENAEIVGEPFFIKITAFKDGEADTKYEGMHQILFKSSAKGSDAYHPQIPAAETIEFTKGIGQTSASFMFTNSSERPTLSAEEKGKALGTSPEITLKAGSMQSINISFEGKKGGYALQGLDKFNNILDINYKLDEEIKPGMILSGSQGLFYEMLDIIGYGGMGKVYKARRLNDDILVAIKTTLLTSLSEIGRFLQEGELLIRFDHPNIVKGYDMGQVCQRKGGRVEIEFYMAMEFLPGLSAKKLIDTSKTGVLAPAWATEIILHVARALAYIWEHKTMHRDIKPDNIQITEDKKIKLIDLGIAKAEGVDINLTNPGTVVGSYPYISPERLKDVGVDFRSDIYSLGATYYHMLTGMPPYLDTYQGSGGKDLLEYLMSVRTKKMPTPPNKLQEMPPSVSNVIMTMLQIKTVKRFNTPDELIKALEQVHQELGGKV